MLRVGGSKQPWSTDAEVDEALAVWDLILANVSDDRLVACTAAYLQSPEARYGWPKAPGVLLAALPDPATVDDADDAWAEALGLIRLRGCERCPATAAELVDLRERATAGAREAEARERPDLAQRYQRIAAAVPHGDTGRLEALLAGVRACGGWRSLGRSTDEQHMAHRAAFRAAYRGQRARRRLTETEERVAALLSGGTVPRHLRLVDGGAP